MSFWSKAGKLAMNVGTAVINQVEMSANEIRELKAKYEAMDDEQLIKIVKKTEGLTAKSKKDRSIAYSILKKRGVDVEHLHSNTEN